MVVWFPFSASGQVGGLHVLPQGYWFTVLYASVVLLICLLVCLVGAHIYSRAAFLILLVITGALVTVLVSTLIVGPRTFTISHPSSQNRSETQSYNASYTGFSGTTMQNNLGRKCGNNMNINSFLFFWLLHLLLFKWDRK